MSENSKTSENNSNIESKPKEYQDFIEAHELQLYGITFPTKELGEELYNKLKNEILDMDEYFEIIDNQPESRYMLISKKDMKPREHVFLAEHAWTFELRSYNNFCKTNPNIIERCTKMLKYAKYKKEVKFDSNLIKNESKPSLNKYIANIYDTKNYKNIVYDDYDIDDNNFSLLIADETTETLSLEDNKISNVKLIEEFLDKYKNIKGLWIRDNSFCEVNENYECDFINKYSNLQLLNRKFTPNAEKWAIEYIMTSNLKDIEWAKEYNKYYGKEKYIDFYARDPFIIKNLFNLIHDITNNTDLFKNAYTIDIGGNDYSLVDPDIQNKIIELLKNLPNTIEKIIIDEDIEEIFENDESNAKDNILMNKDFINTLMKEIPNIKYINDYSIKEIQENNNTYNDLLRMKKEYYVHKYMWIINRNYRLCSNDSYGQEMIWYINDEYATAINHSDIPNSELFPILFSKDNTFNKSELMSYTILWNEKPIKAGEEITIDYLKNNTEKEHRSEKLTYFCDTPREYFIQKFKEKVIKYTNIAHNSNIDKFNEDIQYYISHPDKLQLLTDEQMKELFDFSYCNNNETLIKETIQKIKNSLNVEFIEPKRNYFNKILENNNKIKVYSDLSYVRNNLKLPQFEIVEKFEDADILWLTSDIREYLEKLKKEKTIKENSYVNQYPYEAIITKKDFLMDIIERNYGYNDIIGLSYEGKKELAEIIGNYYYNEDNHFDNIWITKPIGMTRSMDMCISNNISEIIRFFELGEKICQKYISRPYLMNNKKFDLRFIICLKQLFPLELYFYNKMFWIRCSNKDYIKDEKSFDDYEVHFTVMNYGTHAMQTVYDRDFIKYLKDNGIEWDPIYKKLKNKVKKVFNLCIKNCPSMIDFNSRSIYGLDAMLDENLEPYIVEINFQPDCTRACNFVPEFYNDLFKTLFINEPSGVELI